MWKTLFSNKVLYGYGKQEAQLCRNCANRFDLSYIIHIAYGIL